MQKKSTIKQNMLYFIEYKGISKYKFYQETHISRGVLDQNTGITEENIAKFIAYFPEVDIEWLITGRGEMLKPTKEASYDIYPLEINRRTQDYIKKEQQIPLYDLEATAGLQELFKGEKRDAVLDYIKIPGLASCDGAVYVTGDSMYPLLKSGDIVLYKEIDIYKVFWGEIYLLSVKIDEWSEYITVKFVQKSELGEKYIKLVSQNQHHQPKDVLISDISALALVRASIRLHS